MQRSSQVTGEMQTKAMNIVTSLHPGDPQTMEGHAHIHVLGEAGGTKDLGGRYLNHLLLALLEINMNLRTLLPITQ